MIQAEDVNLAMVKQVAELLGPLLPKVVFLGGAATGLLITDEAAPEVRATKDVDVIVEILSRSDYYQLEETLTQGHGRFLGGHYLIRFGRKRATIGKK